MTKSTKWQLLLYAVLMSFLFGREAQAQTVNAASCSSSAVQTAVNAAGEGQTVNIPAGTCSWTSGVSISGKGIRVQGAGAGRVIAVDVESSALSIGTGTKTFTAVTNDMGATAYLNATAPPITVGETLRIIENGFLANFMQGTVTSFSGSTLVLNVTSSGGTCGTTSNNAMNSNCKRWLISTIPSTVLVNNLSGGAMFNITEDTSFHSTLTGVHIAQGSGGGGTGNNVYLNRNNPSGQAILIHDNFFESQNIDLIDGNTSRGVIWNNSFLFSPFSQGQWAAIRTKDSNNTSMPTSWTTPSTMGMADTTGQNNLYFETNDVHADGDMTDFDDNSRSVVRYCVLDNAGSASHGADTSFVGIRHFEFYNNAGIFEGYSDGSTANMNWWMFVRGGTFVWHDNTLPQISSQDYGNKTDIALTVMSLQREDNYACWGSGFSTPGQDYPAPRQVGTGFVTGAGKVSWPAGGYTNATTTSNSSDYSGSVYVGDSEPIYIWNNSRTMNVEQSDYGLNNGSTSCPSSPAPDSTSNYVVSERDYFNGTAKPGYTPYTYPHPLTLGQQTSSSAPVAPTNLTAAVQ
jgi:hypothetical protein